jgi:hypothetical protein
VVLAPLTIAENQVLQRVAPQASITEAFTWLLMAVVLGIAAGNAAGGAIVDAGGWQDALLAAGAATAAGAALTFARRRTLGGVYAPPVTGEQEGMIENELLKDLDSLGDRLRDEKFCTALYRALTRNKWTKDGVEGHVALSFTKAEELVNEARDRAGQPPLTLAQSGGEGEVGSPIEDELVTARGWRIAPLDTGEHDPGHVSKPAESPPRGDGERPEWERQAHEEARRG